jgi:aquaporin NIP
VITRRSIGPASVSGDLRALWLYIVAPILGASLGALTYQLIRGEQTPPAEIGSFDAPREERVKELV